MKIVKQMSAKTKKYLIITQKREVVAIQQKPQFLRRYCERCEQQVEMMTLDTITFKTGKSTRQLFQMIENNLLHSIETGRGHLMICLNSLNETLNKS
jgi:hypothetical protein